MNAKHASSQRIKILCFVLLIISLAACQSAGTPTQPAEQAAPEPTAVPDTAVPAVTAEPEIQAPVTTETTQALPEALGGLKLPTFPLDEIAALCDITPHPDVSGKLKIWGYYNGPMKVIAEEFKKIYPNVELEITDFGLDDNHSRLLAAFTAGAGAPDIAMIQNEFVQTVWGPDGGLLDITDWMGDSAQYFAPEAMRKVSDTQGSMWGVPWDIGPAMVYYRQDVFDKYSIDANAIETWDDYIAAGKKVDQESGGKVKMLISNQILNSGGLFIVLSADQTMLSQQLGSGWWDKAGNPIIDNEANIRAMALLKRFRDESITLNDITGESEVATMKDGSVATYPHAAWWQLEPKFLAPETKGLWNFMKLPAFEKGGVRAANVGGTAFYITKQSQNSDLAKKFLKFFLICPEMRALSYQNSYLFEAILFPAIQTQSIFTDPDPFFNGRNPNITGIESMMEAPPVIEAKGHKEARAIFDANVGDILSGKVTVEEGMKRIQQLVKAALQQ